MGMKRHEVPIRLTRQDRDKLDQLAVLLNRKSRSDVVAKLVHREWLRVCAKAAERSAEGRP
jgi:hypothetical protein